MRWILLCCLCFVVLPAGANEAERNDFWIVWERTLSPLPDCEGEPCNQQMYFGHLIEGMESRRAEQFFAGLGQFTETSEHTNIRMPQSPICLGPQPKPLPDPTTLDLVDRAETLRGLPGVHVDLRGVRGPQSFRGSFGEQAQSFLEETFAKHKIPLLTKEEAAATPGNAVLSMRYSAEVFGCRPWSVSLSLTQRALLARAPDMMLEVGTWAASARQDEANVEFAEVNAMEQVITAFAQAWDDVNGTGHAEDTN